MVERGWGAEFLLDLDIPAFSNLCKLATAAWNRHMIEQAHMMRVAFNGDEKNFKDWLGAYGHDTTKSSPAGGADDFIAAMSGKGKGKK